MFKCAYILMLNPPKDGVNVQKRRRHAHTISINSENNFAAGWKCHSLIALWKCHNNTVSIMSCHVQYLMHKWWISSGQLLLIADREAVHGFVFMLTCLVISFLNILADNERLCEFSLWLMLQILKGKYEDTEANVEDYFYWFPLFLFN